MSSELRFVSEYDAIVASPAANVRHSTIGTERSSPQAQSQSESNITLHRKDNNKQPTRHQPKKQKMSNELAFDSFN